MPEQEPDKPKMQKLLPKAAKLFEMVEELEKKQAAVRATMTELKRSLFHHMAKEIEEAGLGRYDRIRFDLFWQYVKFVIGKTEVCRHDLKNREIWDITGNKNEEEQRNWFLHWRDLGMLNQKTHFSPGYPGHLPDPLYSLKTEGQAVPDAG